jgi:hypothetical protein
VHVVTAGLHDLASGVPMQRDTAPTDEFLTRADQALES